MTRRQICVDESFDMDGERRDNVTPGKFAARLSHAGPTEGGQLVTAYLLRLERLYAKYLRR